MPAPVHRFEVRPAQGRRDPRAQALIRDAAALGITLADARTARIYLIQAPLDPAQLDALRDGLLQDPVTEQTSPGADAPPGTASLIEVHPLPGVMDPVAQSVSESISELLGVQAGVSTGWRYDLEGVSPEQADLLARRLLANPVVHAIHTTPFLPDTLPAGRPYSLKITHVPITKLSDDQLQRLSRDAHLFLSLEEMRAVQAEYRRLGREPTDIELETLAQTWSEHCVHKTLKSRIRYGHGGTEARGHGGADPIRWEGRPGHTVHPDGSVTIDNLLRSTVAAATHELIAGGLDWALSVFVDNAGIIAFDEDHAVCVKVETHNHPSAIEPYGGAATGIGGCIRDIIGTGLAAKPIANTDVFCVAFPDRWAEKYAEDAEAHAESAEGNPGGMEERTRSVQQTDESTVPSGPFTSSSSAASASTSAPSAYSLLPEGCLHPRRILTDIVSGVRDYGNRMGIPTVNGAVYFDDRYVGNPLVFCGSVGVMPKDRIRGAARRGDLIVALGGRTGRDGIHGATFSSAELTGTHADEFAHAVQIGNPIEQKRLLDAILRARDPEPLYSAITDCGAGGFSSAVGEMGEDLGAEVRLDRAPLKYDGLSYTEIWISEAQERMVLAVPEANLGTLQKICDEEGVELAVLGHFGTPGRELILRYHDTEVGRLPMQFLHEGLPTPTREAVWDNSKPKAQSSNEGGDRPPPDSQISDPKSQIPDSGNAAPSSPSLRRSISSSLLPLLAHPNIASKHWLIRQYDHEVQGNLILKPLVGPQGRGPGDAAVIEPVPGTGRGLAIANGMGVSTLPPPPPSPTGGVPAQRAETPSPVPDGGGPRAAGGGGPPVSQAPVVQASGPPSSLPGHQDPYTMALAAIDECIRNLVCAGADPDRTAILDNFCWPSCNRPENLGARGRAAEGCYDGAKAYETPFVSGKDSLNNQFTTDDGRTIQIPYTLLISGIAIVPDIARATTSDAKEPGNALILVGQTQAALAGSHYAALHAQAELEHATHPAVDLDLGPRLARAVAALIRDGLVRSAHDCSDGGLLVAVAEMLIAGSSQTHPIGAQLDLAAAHPDPAAAAYAESPSRYILEVRPEDLPAAETALKDLPWSRIATLDDSGRLTCPAADLDESVENLTRAWRRTLDW